MQAPAVQVLELRSASLSRHPSDLLPYLPQFRVLFTLLPHKKSELRFRAATIPLSDIECITQTLMKVSFNIQTRNFAVPNMFTASY